VNGIVEQKQRHLDALPDGWFYNGRSYVSMDGERSDRHPGNTSMNLFVIVNHLFSQLIILCLKHVK